MTNNRFEKLNEYINISTMTIATCGKDGQPHAAPVYFVADEACSFYFFSSPSSQHIIDISHNDHAAAAIYPECYEWEGIRGIQMNGTIIMVESKKEKIRVSNLYIQKFPFSHKILAQLKNVELFQFIPTWARISDNRVKFGHNEEIVFDR